MNRRIGYAPNSRKPSLHPQNGKRMELQRGKSPATEKSRRQRKLALVQDVDNLKKKLRQEENVHRALERAFTRPLGALPRLPAYLPQYTLELLAEVAVLEEEVVRLEEKIVHFRQGLYQEAVYLSSRNSALYSSPSRKELLTKASKQRRHSRSSSHSELNLKSSESWRSPILSRVASTRKFLLEYHVSDGLRHCSQSLPNANHHQKDQLLVSENGPERKKRCSPESGKDKPYPEPKSLVVETPVRRDQLKPGILEKNVHSPKIQYRKVEQSQESSDDRALSAESEANTISQDILRCLISIFVRLSSFKEKTMDSESFSSLAPNEKSENDEESNFRDPYCKFSVFKKRDIGTYKHLLVIEATSVDFHRKANESFLIRRLNLLLEKLASLSLAGLSHHQKLAFWINIYNACIMKAFLEHGIPDSPDMVVLQMQKATINVGGHLLNALTIEHLILRLPYHLKYTCSKSVKNEGKICGTLGLEWSEPLVTFALSCGSWSSPAVKVYTASGVETELEVAKKEYLQAAVGISSANKLILPKLLDWYLLDFAKDLDSLVDWICLQLPNELRDQTLNCLQTRGKEPLSKVVQVMPYDFRFRYLVSRRNQASL